MIRRIILTGAPGAGKTTVLGHLADAGHTVIAEAATDLIETDQAAGNPEPWEDPGFCDRIAASQRDRQLAAGTLPGPVQYFDRSPVCTLALARFKGHSIGPVLAAEIDRIATEAVYDRRVLFVEQLGFITRTEVRRIGFEAALHFEQIHRETYRALGYACVSVPAAAAAERAALVQRLTTQKSHA